VVDAYRRGKSEDVILIPVAIAYDQIQDVGSYTAEQHGAKKQTESFGWFLNVIRGLQTRFGDIYIRFGKPISLAQQLGPPDPLAVEHGSRDDTEEQHLSIQKLAFEVAVRINRVTPITPTSLVALALLGRGDRALSVPELVVALQNLVEYIRRRGLPTTVELGLESPASVQRTLDALVSSGVVTCYAEGPEAVYAVGPDQHLTAAYYRNTIIHYFVNAAIAEIALLRAGEDHVDKRRTMFWEEAMRLRDLFKFEFFFAEKERFREEVAEEIAPTTTRWPAGARPGGHAGPRPVVSAVQRASGAPAVPARLSRGRPRAPTREAGRAVRSEHVSRPLPGARQAVPAPAPHPERRVGVEGAVRDGAPSGRKPRPARGRRPRSRRAPQGVRRRDPQRHPARRRDRAAGAEPGRGVDSLTRVPVTIVGGFLGSGKTTRVNALLREPHGRRVAVVLNEMGEVGIDAARLAGAEEFVELDGGCICCALNADLEATLGRLRARGGFDHLVIETTGIADPLPVAWTFERPALREGYRVDAVAVWTR
jgi:hypothetical protein